MKNASIARNKKVSFDYEIIERFEAGLVLVGTEVKSVKQRKCNISDAHVIIKDKEMYIANFYISKYDMAFKDTNHDPLRYKKLLLHKKEIIKIQNKMKKDNLAVVASEVFVCKNGKIKINIALGRGRKKQDKRQHIKARDLQREERKNLNIF